MGETKPMTLAQYVKIRKELKTAEPEDTDKVMPTDVEKMLSKKLDEDVEVKDLEFDQETGRYTATTTNNLRFQICAVCGFKQPHNIKAMKEIVPELVKDLKQEYRQEEFTDHNGEFTGTTEEVEERVEGDLCRWNNNTCETRHPAYQRSQE